MFASEMGTRRADAPGGPAGSMNGSTGPEKAYNGIHRAIMFLFCYSGLPRYIKPCRVLLVGLRERVERKD
jgi:hypothetical protein